MNSCLRYKIKYSRKKNTTLNSTLFLNKEDKDFTVKFVHDTIHYTLTKVFKMKKELKNTKGY